MIRLKGKGCMYVVTSAGGDLPRLVLIFLVFFTRNRMADICQAR